jgi:hypothetical protein
MYAKHFQSMKASHCRPDTSRHPGMHRTATLDYIVVLSGRVTLLLDDEDINLESFDVVVQRGLSRGPVREEDLRIMRRIDELHLEHPFYGARWLAKQLEREGFEVGRAYVTTLMRRMGIEALYRRPRTSIPTRDAKIYPYLLDGLAIERPNQVWSSDLTYLPSACSELKQKNQRRS